MSIVQLTFAEPFYSIEYVEEEESYEVKKKSMVINLAERVPSSIELAGERSIPPLKAAILQNTTITHVKKAFVILDVERTDIYDPAVQEEIKKTWPSIYEMSGIERHKGLPYYKSPKFCIGEGSNHIELNLCLVTQGMVPSGPHRDHDRNFDEVHAQIAGYGMMRIYDYDDKENIHQELNMAPGVVHDKMYDSKGCYPWHEYKSVTPCVYCPIELDR